jgi:hypothetical protein
MGYQVIKYDHPVIIVQDTRGRTEKFSVSDDGTVEDRGRFMICPGFVAQRSAICTITARSFRAVIKALADRT